MGVEGKWMRSLACLALISFLFYYDRSVVAIIVEPLKHDLRLDDAQIGLITGLAFIILASVVAIPLANRADNVGRVVTLGWALALWSVGTAFSALAANLWVLVLARMCVGATEAVGFPNIQAITADSFPDGRVTTAFGVISLAGNLGGACALIAGGFLSAAFGWRAVFWAGSAAGVGLSILFRLTFNARSDARDPRLNPDRSISIWAALGHFAKLPAFIYFALGISIAAIGIFAFFTWIPALLMRKFGASVGEIGLTYGLITGVASLLGPSVSGVVCDRIARDDPRRLVWIIIVLLSLVAPLTVLAIFAATLRLAFTLLFPANFLLMGIFPPCYALTQHLSSSGFRTMGATIFGTAVTVVGLLIGPTVVGVLSDAFRPYVGDASLQYAVTASIVSYVIAVVLLLFSIRHIMPDIRRMQAAAVPRAGNPQISIESR
jgi:predicted MFS family arabinose efflux permease